jgi:GNAT superfamily N-acetyltransferase
MHIQTITPDEFFAHPCAPELLDAYALESAIEGLPRPHADADAYRLLATTGGLTVLAAMEGEALVGFMTLLVYGNPHYSAVLGVVESYFVAPAARSTGAGNALRETAERFAAERGAAGLLISAPLGGRLARVMEHTAGYRESNRVFFRKLTP